MVLVEIVDSFLQLRAALRLLDGQAVQVGVGVERELVHRVDGAHVVEHEEQDCRTLGARTVTLRSPDTNSPCLKTSTHCQRLRSAIPTGQ